jgi:DNA-directed RNA polymerase III subunit RPC8
MFILVALEDNVRVQPADLSKKPVDAVTDVLQETFVNKVIHDVGLVVTIYDVQAIEGGYVYPNDGCAFFTVKFRLVVLRPFAGEVIVGKIVGSDK